MTINYCEYPRKYFVTSFLWELGTNSNIKEQWLAINSITKAIYYQIFNRSFSYQLVTKENACNAVVRRKYLVCVMSSTHRKTLITCPYHHSYYIHNVFVDTKNFKRCVGPIIKMHLEFNKIERNQSGTRKWNCIAKYLAILALYLVIYWWNIWRNIWQNLWQNIWWIFGKIFGKLLGEIFGKIPIRQNIWGNYIWSNI